MYVCMISTPCVFRISCSMVDWWVIIFLPNNFFIQFVRDETNRRPLFGKGSRLSYRQTYVIAVLSWVNRLRTVKIRKILKLLWTWRPYCAVKCPFSTYSESMHHFINIELLAPLKYLWIIFTFILKYYSGFP